MKDQSLKYLFNIIPKINRPYSTSNENDTAHFKVKHCFFEKTIFLSFVTEWNKLDPKTQNAPSLSIFKKNILKFIRPIANKIFSCHNVEGIILQGYDMSLVTSTTLKLYVTLSSTVLISFLKETLFSIKLPMLIVKI